MIISTQKASLLVDKCRMLRLRVNVLVEQIVMVTCLSSGKVIARLPYLLKRCLMLILSEASFLINDCLADFVFNLGQLLLKLFFLFLLFDNLSALTLKTSFVLFDICDLVSVLPLNLSLLISKSQLLLK